MSAASSVADMAYSFLPTHLLPSPGSFVGDTWGGVSLTLYNQAQLIEYRSPAAQVRVPFHPVVK